MLVHMFGCWFGLAVGLMFRPAKRDAAEPADDRDEKSDYNGNTFAFLGTMLLFALFPSFNAAFVLPEQQIRVAINTLLALCCSVCGAFIVSHSGLQTGNRFGPLEIHHATIAGGVGVASTATYFYPPVASMLVGFLLGMVSTAIYLYILPALRRFVRIGDTTGTLALHGFPGFLGSIAALIVVAASDSLQSKFGLNTSKSLTSAVAKIPGLADNNITVSLGYTFAVKPTDLYGVTGSTHLQTHGLIILISIFLPLVAGFFTGLFLRFVGWACKLTIADQDLYQDKTTFKVPQDYPGE